MEEVHKSEMKAYKHKNTGHYNSKQQLALHHTDQRNQFEREQRQTHEMELRKWKRRRLIGRIIQGAPINNTLFYDFCFDLVKIRPKILEKMVKEINLFTKIFKNK